MCPYLGPVCILHPVVFFLKKKITILFPCWKDPLGYIDSKSLFFLSPFQKQIKVVQFPYHESFLMLFKPHLLITSSSKTEALKLTEVKESKNDSYLRSNTFFQLYT